MTTATKINYETQQKCLKVIMLSQLLVECIDDISGTTLYKQNVKNQGNRFIKTLKPYLKQTAEINKANPEMANNVYNNVEQLISKLGQTDLTGLIMINQIYDHYSQFPKDWEQFFEVELEKLQ